MLLPAERRYVSECGFLFYLASQGWIGTVVSPGIPMPPCRRRHRLYLHPPSSSSLTTPLSERYAQCLGTWLHLPGNKIDLSQCGMRSTERPTANATLEYDESVWSEEIVYLS